MSRPLQDAVEGEGDYRYLTLRPTYLSMYLAYHAIVFTIHHLSHLTTYLFVYLRLNCIEKALLGVENTNLEYKIQSSRTGVLQNGKLKTDVEQTHLVYFVRHQ